MSVLGPGNGGILPLAASLAAGNNAARRTDVRQGDAAEQQRFRDVQAASASPLEDVDGAADANRDVADRDGDGRMAWHQPEGDAAAEQDEVVLSGDPAATAASPPPQPPKSVDLEGRGRFLDVDI